MVSGKQHAWLFRLLGFSALVIAHQCECTKGRETNLPSISIAMVAKGNRRGDCAPTHQQILVMQLNDLAHKLLLVCASFLAGLACTVTQEAESDFAK